MKILLLSCGGTIVSRSPLVDKAGAEAMEDAALELKNAIMTPIFAQALEERAQPFTDRLYERGLEPYPEITPKDLLVVDSTEVGPVEWRKIIEAVLEDYDNYDGFIITHGTNSLAYTASTLTFGLPLLGKPIVMTGSNTAIGPPYSDASVNASYAVLLVQKMVAEEKRGVMVVFASKIMPGPRAKKVSGTEMEAFRTFNAPDIGQMRPKGIIFREGEYEKYLPDKITTSPWHGKEPLNDSKGLREYAHFDFDGVVSSLTFHPGDDPGVYNAILDYFRHLSKTTKQRGAMIIRGVGDGDTSKIIQDKVFRRAQDEEVPIVITTQEPQGTSSLQGNEQSEGVSLLGVIPAWDMSIETMVVKLRYLLGSGTPYAEIREEFTRSYFGEIEIGKH